MITIDIIRIEITEQAAEYKAAEYLKEGKSIEVCKELFISLGLRTTAFPDFNFQSNTSENDGYVICKPVEKINFLQKSKE